MEKGPPATRGAYDGKRKGLHSGQCRHLCGASEPPERGDASAIPERDQVQLRMMPVPEQGTRNLLSSAFCMGDVAEQGMASNVELSEAVSAHGLGGAPAVANGLEGKPRLLPPAPQHSQDAALPAAPVDEDSRYLSSAPPTRFSGVPGRGENREERLPKRHGTTLLPPKLSSADPAFLSTCTPFSFSPVTVSDPSYGDISSPTRFLEGSTVARPAPVSQTSSRGWKLSNSARTLARSRSSHTELISTVNGRGVAAEAAEPATAAAAARGATAASERVDESAVDRPLSSATGIDDGPAAVSEASFRATSCGTRVRCTSCRAAGAERRHAVMVPQGFSLAHIPSGFLWGRPRVGALRLLYKRAGNPDCLLLFGPNWNFAVAMFFLHILGITFFLYVLHAEFKEDLWLFAGGVILCMVTFASFLSTVFKDPGLPLKVSLAELQPQLLTSTTSRLHLPKTWIRHLQLGMPRGLRGRLLASKARDNYRHKSNRVLAFRLFGKRVIQRRTVLFTGREMDILRGRRVCSPDDGRCRHRGSPCTAGSGTSEEINRLQWRQGSFTDSSRSSGRSSAKDGYANSHRRDNGNSTDSGNSDDDSDSSKCTTEVMSDTSGETEVLSDGIRKADNSGSEENSTVKRLTLVPRGKRLLEGTCPTRRLLRRSVRTKRDLCQSTCGVRGPREKHPRQHGATSPTVAGKKTGDLQDVCSPTRGNAKTSVPHPFYGACENPVKLRVHSVFLREQRLHARRRKMMRPWGRFALVGIQGCRENDLGFDSLSAGVHVNGYSAVPVIQGSPCSARSYLYTRHGRRTLVRGVKFSRGQYAQGYHELVANCAEGDDSDSQHSRFCVICKIAPPPGAYHCEECRVCIEGYDHHCPWTSKCIGKGNTREFYTWILFTLVTVLYFGLTTTLLRQDEDADPSGGETRPVHINATAYP